MEETIFFNLGNAIASSKDEKELIRTAQIEHDNRKMKGRLVIVEDPENGEQLLFDFSDAENNPGSGKKFIIKQSLENEKQ
ncbi:hypothetical protein LI951_04815 [Enterococcus sp. BWT-B8]|uniref:hypothetical protein n=1 Tax=Enterococcus sp. BWT-B8 TaxID=2885157 RepID=UPI001E3C1E1E|nr:hypothetical protein [Enterococcus sp. BWT-B8]MCB5951378.1 hypothetical protein [Enterococcus sp. BWT-B8]